MILHTLFGRVVVSSILENPLDYLDYNSNEGHYISYALVDVPY